jgi:hypothetical protein
MFIIKHPDGEYLPKTLRTEKHLTISVIAPKPSQWCKLTYEGYRIVKVELKEIKK